MTSYYKIDHCMFTFASGLPRPPALTGWNADWVDLSVVFKICWPRNLDSMASSPNGLECGLG